MNDHDAELLRLYDEQHHLYQVYVSIERGDDLGQGFQVSPKRVKAARLAWVTVYEQMRDAGGDPPTIRRLLNERVAESEVKAR
jgi:hypothetical protein